MARIMMGIAVVALALAAAGGWYAKQKSDELESTKRELATATASLQKATAEARAAKDDAAAARKELAEQKTALDKLTAEMAAASAFMEAEKAIGMRLRQELSLANDKIALLTRRPGSTINRVQVMPSVIQAQPLRVVPIGSGAAIGAASPARPAGQ